MVEKLPYVVLLAAIALLGLWAANFLYDRGIRNWVSRKAAHITGGTAFLLSPLFFEDAWIPVALAASFTALLALLHFRRLKTIRGTGRKEALAEVWFPAAGGVVLFFGWGLLDLPWPSVACVLLMAYSDAVTGLIRAPFYDGPTKGWWGSLGFLVTGLVITTLLIEPIWLAVVAATLGMLIERYCGDVGRVRWVDDNWGVPIGTAIIVLPMIHMLIL